MGSLSLKIGDLILIVVETSIKVRESDQIITALTLATVCHFSALLRMPSTF